MTKRRHRRESWRGVLGAAVVALGVAAFAALDAAPATADDNDPTPPPGDGGSGRPNACTPQQIEGGYEDLNGRCQLTGWNWQFGNPCVSDAEIGRLGDTSACGPSGCVTETCGGGEPPGDGPGSRPDGDDNAGPIFPWPAGDFDSFESFDGWCRANGGEVVVIDLTTDPESPDLTHMCARGGGPANGGELLGLCEELGDLEFDCEPGPDAIPPHEFPAPEPGGPADVEAGTGVIDDVAAPGDEPSGPVGPVVTVDLSTGVVLSDLDAPAGNGDETGEPSVPAPPTTSGGFDVFDAFDVPVATSEVANDEG